MLWKCLLPVTKSQVTIRSNLGLGKNFVPKQVKCLSLSEYALFEFYFLRIRVLWDTHHGQRSAICDALPFLWRHPRWGSSFGPRIHVGQPETALASIRRHLNFRRPIDWCWPEVELAKSGQGAVDREPSVWSSKFIRLGMFLDFFWSVQSCLNLSHHVCMIGILFCCWDIGLCWIFVYNFRP